VSQREEDAGLADMIGREVVVDTRSPYVYLGTLRDCTSHFIGLGDVDVHDSSESRTTKELYIMNARHYGIRRNRAAVRIRRDEVISISLLADVLVFE